MTKFLILSKERKFRTVEEAVNLETALHLSELDEGEEYEAYALLQGPKGESIKWEGTNE